MKANVWIDIAGIVATLLGAGPLTVPAVASAKRLVDYLGKVKENAQRTGEWTAAERKQVDARWIELTSSKAWRTDAEGGL